MIADRIIARNRERIREEAHAQGREEGRKEIIRQLESLPENVRSRIPFLSDLSEGDTKKN